ncbi:alpha-hydroxy-acid oxidizing protein [Streptomyces coelicolor]|uniref:2-hydroxy-acid oxidase n=1 Tax=Streptomyces toyocaensis TaxID=55952 RepID=Q8KLK1_STRTO|nr:MULTISPECIES: alpha-hydroxy acid oxidase [Streptomyces]AAM80552.1 Hmo [Streptomyces toyocaensis]KES08693.1 2-hydroxy-acid oxidase [Streptomyces toyocaensis]NSL78878.1 alpha-hydroxy-acid oxidizing protein [Streptomyces coelicolor]QKN67432.1 alpha-hydroxy-acid oxidizing protein [Streptomyces coelicolor]
MGHGSETAAAPAHCLADFERAAASVLPADVRDFVAGGSGAEVTLDANRTALDRVFLVPRVLRDVSRCTADSTLLKRPVPMPVAVAPVAYQQLVHPDGERAAARAAKAAGVPFTASTLSSVPIEELTAIGGTVWFQLYRLRDAAQSLELVRRAEDAGCEAIMLTVDVPWMGRRLRDVRNRFALPSHVRAANISTGSTAHRRHADSSAVAVHTGQAFSSATTWSSLAALRKQTRLPLLLKGVLAAEDAVRAVESGVDAVVVSNHGGRQLDGAVPSIDVLPEVAAAVNDGCEVLLDSGIRSGTDVLRALALGASGVLVGRPLIWGLAAAGEAGARRVLDLLADELRDALGLSGCDGVAAARQLRTLVPG